MIFNPTEKQVPCPRCGIGIDLDSRKYGLNRPVIEKCPWCARLLRITKILRIKPMTTNERNMALNAIEDPHYKGMVELPQTKKGIRIIRNNLREKIRASLKEKP